MALLVAIVGSFFHEGDEARGAGPLVVVEDVSSSGAGYFTGSVCFQVIRDQDGTVISDNCVDAPAAFAAPDGLEVGVPYSISISLSDPNCVLSDDSRVGDGSTPFVIRVSCDPAFMTSTAAAQPTSTPTPLPTDTPTPPPSPTPSPASTPTPASSPAHAPTPEPTGEPTFTPTAAVSMTAQPEMATPPPTETPAGTAAGSGDSAPEVQSGPGGYPQVLDVQLSELDGTGGEQRVRGTVSVWYEIAPSPEGTVSVLFSIGSLGTAADAIVPGEVTLVAVGALSPAGSETAALGCWPLSEEALPVSLELSVPVVTCTETAGGAYRQELIFEFTATSAATIDDYHGSVALTMAIAP